MEAYPVGIVAEFDPFHRGHACLLAEVRRLRPDSPIVVAMSGRFTQRGGAACLSPQRRAEMALNGGADLVLELPLTWAISSAQQFAAGGVAVLGSAGVREVFCGSECADLPLLTAAARALKNPEYPDLLRTALSAGVSFAAARQQAVAQIAGEPAAALLSQPNDLLAVSYLEAMGEAMTLSPILRTGPGHNAPNAEGGFASASLVRRLLQRGDWEQALSLVPESAQGVLRQAMEAGEAPADLILAERAVLARLRQMSSDDFAALPDCSEGLEHRLWRCARTARSLAEFLETARSRRYPLARIRRLALWSFLGLERSCVRQQLPYLRVLGMDGRGRQVLREMDREALSVLTAPNGGKKLTGDRAAYLHLEERAADLWQLCLPAVGPCGSLWRANPVMRSSPESGWD